MNKYIPLLLVSFFLQANEVFFNAINESENDAIEISFNLDKVAYINSYSLENPSRIVIEINDSKLTNPIEEIYNYPIKKVRASNLNGMTRIVIDLYDNVFWNKPIQKETDNGVLLSTKINVLLLHRAIGLISVPQLKLMAIPKVRRECYR